MESVESLVPYLKANPAFKFMIESFVECRSQCTMDHCNNQTARISIVYFSRKDAGTTSRSRPGDVAMEGATLSSSNGTRARASRAADVCVAHHPWDHQGLPLPHLSLQALHDLPPVRDDTEYEKLLAEPEGREMALRAKDQSVEAEAAQAKLGEAKLQQETEDEEAEAVRKSLGERGAVIAMAKAMERAELEKAKKFEEEMQQTNDSETQDMLEKQRQYADSLRKNKMSSWLRVRRRRGKSDKAATSWSQS